MPRRCRWGAAEVLRGSMDGDAAGMLRKCRGGAAEVPRRCRGDAAVVPRRSCAVVSIW